MSIIQKRKALVTQGDLLLKKESRNPIAKQFRGIFDESFRNHILPSTQINKGKHSEIFTPDKAPLYRAEREWLIEDNGFDKKENPYAYERYLHSHFWNESDQRRLVFVLGEIGCGKSTFVDYYLRCFCPNDAESKEKFKEKLVINVDTLGIQSVGEFKHKFFSRAKGGIQKKCKEFGIKLRGIKKVEGRSAEEWVEEALKILSFQKTVTQNKHHKFKYIVLCIDNLDQSPLDVQGCALRLVRDWLEDTSQIELWRVYVPLWPNTLHEMEMRRHFAPPKGGCHIVKLGGIQTKDLVATRSKAASECIFKLKDTWAWVDESGKKHEEGSDETARFFKTVCEWVSDDYLDFLDQLAYGDMRRVLGMWMDIASSNVLFQERIKGKKALRWYEFCNALFTGRYAVHNKMDTFIPNLFYFTETAYNERDLLIGPHVLALMDSGIGSYAAMRHTLRRLNYTENNIKEVLDGFYFRNAFHLKSSDSKSQDFVVHKKTVSALLKLLDAPAFIDNMAMVTPLPINVLASKDLTRTVSYKGDDFTSRVKTTMAFMKQVKADEEIFCSGAHCHDKVAKERFENELVKTKLICISSRIARAYKNRLDNLRNDGWLAGANGVNETWWLSVFMDRLFSNLDNAPEFLTPRMRW